MVYKPHWFTMSPFNMVADNGFPRGSGSYVGFSFPFRGMPQYIPFDEKYTNTWKYAAEAALEVIGALNIARGKEFVIPVPWEGNTPVCYCQGLKTSGSLDNRVE